MLAAQPCYVLSTDPGKLSSADELSRCHSSLQTGSETLEGHAEAFLVNRREALVGIIEQEAVGAIGNESRQSLTFCGSRLSKNRLLKDKWVEDRKNSPRSPKVHTSGKLALHSCRSSRSTLPNWVFDHPLMFPFSSSGNRFALLPPGPATIS